VVAGRALFALLVFVGCRSSADPVADPPLPYSVLVTGGAFIVPGPADPDVPPLARTYRPATDRTEAFEIAEVVRELRDGNVFVRIAEDPTVRFQRYDLAHQRTAVMPGQDGLQALLRKARRDGHDLLLVLEELKDDGVIRRGINGQWPITASVWLLIGLGMVIPDHTFESQAALHMSLRDVQTGAIVYNKVLSGGVIDLSLIGRSDFLGLLISVIVPPFWVDDDDAKLEARIRELTSAQMLESMSAQLKSLDVRSAVDRASPAVLEVTQNGNSLAIHVSVVESLSLVRMRGDGTPMRGVDVDAFEQRLMSSVRQDDDRLVYDAEFVPSWPIMTLQLLVQTVSGRVASATMPLSR